MVAELEHIAQLNVRLPRLWNLVILVAGRVSVKLILELLEVYFRKVKSVLHLWESDVCLADEFIKPIRLDLTVLARCGQYLEFSFLRILCLHPHHGYRRDVVSFLTHFKQDNLSLVSITRKILTF